MVVKFNGKDLELKYTFNSFKYMKEFSTTMFDKVNENPFLIIDVLEVLLLGALNHDKKKVFTEDDVDNILEELSDNGQLSEVLEYLMELLQNSSFFKGLQKEKK